MTQKINITQVRADARGAVVSDETGLTIKEVDTDNSVLSGSFDPNNGQLIINIPTIGRLQIGGLPTIHDVGYGPAGMPGAAGRDGTDGLVGTDGKRGTDGCPGPRGGDGAAGRPGGEGRRGNRGSTGATGATGPTGAAGRVLVFVQQQDPRASGETIEAGTIWVRA